MRAVVFIAVVAGTVMVTGALVMTEPPDEALSAPVPARVIVGEIVDPAQVHVIERPGLYGLGGHLPGSDYAVVRSTLVRIDPAQMMVQSIIRPVVRTID